MMRIEWDCLNCINFVVEWDVQTGWLMPFSLIRKDKVLTEVAEKRLQSIKEFTELGSGFKIAMRDLSIRGAGNLLGAQQHGFIDSVGFDLYSQMLKEAVEAKRNDLSVEEKESLDLDLRNRCLYTR